MAILQLQTLTDGTPHYTFRSQLEGVDYEFTLRYGERRECWVLDMATLDGVIILTGKLVTCGSNLLRRVSVPERPPGELWAWNGSFPTDAQGGLFALPGLYDLGPGGRCRLLYKESTDE